MQPYVCWLFRGSASCLVLLHPHCSNFLAFPATHSPEKVYLIYTVGLMFKHRKLLILAILLVAVAGIGLFLYHRTAQTPEAAALLPEGDLLVYANLKPIHLFDLANSSPIKMEGK